MKRLLAGVGLTLFLLTMTALGATRDAQWKEVNDAVNKGLPKTAIEKLEPIIQGALKDKAWGEATKAIARKIVLEGNIQGNKPEEKITRMEAEIAKAPKEIVPLLDTILANWYWHYFHNNRWRFMQRTQTARQPGKDFTTWDLPRLFAEIDKQFTKALSAADTLKKTPIATFDDLLQKGTLPDTYRPTLYDFIANEALEFYTSGEQAAANAQDEFELTVDDIMPGMTSPFADAERFLAVERMNVPLTAEQRTRLNTMRASRLGKAYFLFRNLMAFHERDNDKSAFLDADLARLVWAHNVAFGENKNDRYKSALKTFVDKWADHEISAMALHHWARAVQQEEDLVGARNLALRGANAHRDSPGAKLCRNLVSEIEAKSYNVSTERVWNAPWPRIRVHYRNLTNIHFRAVPHDWNLFLDQRRNRPESLSDGERQALLDKAAALEWKAVLPSTPDYRERMEELAAPETLKPGFYFLIASQKADFSETDNQVTFTDIWVSDLALVVRPRNGNLEGFVLEANSGEPVNGAEVAAWYLDNQGKRIAVTPVRTDENGFFTINSSQQRGHLLRVRHNGRELASQQEYWSHNRGERRPNNQTIFFTDRALYRPGQTIQYKGICLRVDQEKNDYDVLGGQRVTVIFADPNNKEIARQDHRCNDYGSFSGSFTAPRDRLMGAMRIYVTSGPNGQAGFNVEEYKRPKFQVTLDAPKSAAKLSDKVTLQGKAESYTGAAIDGAQVKYRVIREVRWPYWWGWYRSWRVRSVSASQEIAHGTATTQTDGTFGIEFVAKPDPKVSPEDEASFSFSIFADVTDTTGETRSAQRSINVGFTALQATLDAGDWQTDDKPVELNVRATTLDGEPQVAEGSVKVHRLKPPERVHRPFMGEISSYRPGPTPETPDLSDPNWWELGEIIEERGFTTDTNGVAKLSVKLGVGVYRALLETQDRFGKKVTAREQIRVLKPDDTKLAIRIPHLLDAPQWSLEPGEEFMALWGTGYNSGRAFVEIEHRQKMIQRYWTKPGQTQQQIRQAVTEAMRGGFTLHVTQVRENRAYLESRQVNVPWSNKDLQIKWEHFTSKLGPSQKETWTAVIIKSEIRNPKSGFEKAVAEMVATLYDQSLDQFMPLYWQQRFSIFYHDYSTAQRSFENGAKQFQWLRGQWTQPHESVVLRYREFPGDLVANLWGYGWAANGKMRSRGLSSRADLSEETRLGLAVAAAPAAEMALSRAEGKADYAFLAKDAAAGAGGAAGAAQTKGKGPDLSQVTARRNLNETAFFFPQLLSDSNGVVRLTFTMPEALTTWRFLGFAHDRQLRSGFLEDKAVTSKDLMVQPNPPRFVREADLIEFTVKVSNQTTNRQTGKVRLTFNSALNQESADAVLGNSRPELDFDIPAKESRSYSWRIKVPDGAPFLTYKAVGATDKVSDGEEGYLPVLSRFIFVTESLPLPIRGQATKKFEFEKLLKSARSKTLRHQNFTVQMVSNPSWYAVMALPYLMEYPHECTEQTFNRLYANALARHIANSDPKIRRVFDQWKGTAALDSPLEKNQDLKSVMVEETPWLRQAQDESQARKNVGVLFDDNRLNSETERTLQKLAELQLPDGSWPWFPGGRGNDYITLYITTGFGRMRHLGVDINVAPGVKSLNRLDAWMDEHYREILKMAEPAKYVPSATDALYLYGRSFFLKDQPVAAQHKEAIEFFLARARDHWLKVNNRQSQGHLAIALKRFNAVNTFNDSTPADIMKSIKERSVTNEEMGMFWRETELSWWWYRAPIETQAMMIEAFDEVAGDLVAVEECRVWLLKQKQTQDWKTTKATADAVYALLLRGKDILTSDRLVEVTVGGINVTPGRDAALRRPGSAQRADPTIEPGTGFYERRFNASEIRPRLGEITVKKVDEGVAWGSVHWQYLEDMSKVTPHEGTPLKLRKSLYTKNNTTKGPTIEPVKSPVAVGDELVVRIELRVDRDMEYIHLKDQRGSGTEPVNVISHYKYQDGLAYYESTRDTASHFFIDYLPKGTYVFEYSTRVQLRGEYQTGIAEIQCMYAPEFNSHSESIPLTVR
ncbi:MAG TPA: alpha-2-macroglobulin family protein [Verrucomicrobiae bacterium]|nr:alpha-2-macroglobulin family protein [Verrucomicrobiae bacterium]